MEHDASKLLFPYRDAQNAKKSDEDSARGMDSHAIPQVWVIRVFQTPARNGLLTLLVNSPV